jgi:hypothetical protein
MLELLVATRCVKRFGVKFEEAHSFDEARNILTSNFGLEVDEEQHKAGF